MSSPDRTLYIDGFARWCEHVYEDVRSADGKKLYGGRCARCGFQCGLGPCAACGKKMARLTLVAAAGERFCNQACKDEHTKERQEAARAEAVKARKERRGRPRPTGCEHRLTEDVVASDGHVVGGLCLECRQPLTVSASRGASTR